MAKMAITEEMHLEKEWFKEAREIKNREQLTTFMKHVMNDYEHDYGTVCHAIAACALAAACCAERHEGITGFQAGFVMCDFVRQWLKQGNKCGLRLVDYDDFLYPQYEYKYEKTLDADTWKNIQEEARKNLEHEDWGHPRVREHWQKIVDGVVPFGYKVVTDD